MDYERFRQERITSTKIQPYHMITAVTQRAINKQLSMMHKVNPTLRNLSLKSTDPEDDYSGLEAELDPPTRELRLGTENRIVIFCLNIKRATLKYWGMKEKQFHKGTKELPSCVLALSVNLTFKGVAFHNLPKEVQNRLKVKNDYSVRQLLVDFTSASLARLDLQRTTVQDHIKDPNANASFNVFVEKYFTMLAQNHDTVLHYLPLANTECRKQYVIPTVPPTDFTFQSLPFVISDADTDSSSDDNMLIYLQMTGNTPLPRQLLPISTNWVVPTPENADRYDGTVALSREIFLEGWLLPRLAEFNKRSTYVATDAWWNGHGIGPNSYHYYLNGQLGRDNATAAELLFTPVTKDKVDQSVLTGLDLDTPGHWYQYKSDSLKHSPQDDLLRRHVWLSGVTDNYMFIPEGYNKDGKCQILLKGSTLIKFEVALDSISYNTQFPFPLEGSILGKWSTSIILDGINGEIVIKVDEINPKIEENIDEKLVDRDEIKTFREPLKDRMKHLTMTDLMNDMRDVLGNAWEFVLPGAGDFYIHKAMFNGEEDLLCELKYKFQA